MPIAGNTPEDVERRRLAAMKLRIAGKSYTQIGQELGVSRVQAYDDVNHELILRHREMAETIEDARAVELERLDVLLSRLWPFIDMDNPSLDHMEAYMKTVARRAKLLGLDAAGKSEVTIRDAREKNESDAEIMVRVRSLRERLARLVDKPGLPEAVIDVTPHQNNPATDPVYVVNEDKTAAESSVETDAKSGKS